MPTIVLHEVIKWMLRRYDWSRARFAYASMKLGVMVDLDDALAVEAARLSLEHRLSTADSIILASARAHGATLWTQDHHFEGLENVHYIPRQG